MVFRPAVLEPTPCLALRVPGRARAIITPVDGPTRRTVLATGGVLALAACLPVQQAEPPPPDPDLVLRRRVATEVRRLVAAYAAVLAAFPAARSRLATLAAEHEAHVTALAGPRRRPGAAPAAPQVPRTLGAASTWLAGIEQEAAHRRTAESLEAGDDLARLLASVAACNTVHAALLARAVTR